MILLQILFQYESHSFFQDPVQPVVFDWQKSGLKNPLEQNGEFVFSLG
jgi:hypothetical protein